MRGRQQARITNLEENGARLKRNTSSVFKILRRCAPENQTEKTPELLWMGEKKFSQPKQLWENGREWGKI